MQKFLNSMTWNYL